MIKVKATTIEELDGVEVAISYKGDSGKEMATEALALIKGLVKSVENEDPISGGVLREYLQTPKCWREDKADVSFSWK